MLERRVQGETEREGGIRRLPVRPCRRGSQSGCQAGRQPSE